jgi:hypothetical protein
VPESSLLYPLTEIDFIDLYKPLQLSFNKAMGKKCPASAIKSSDHLKKNGVQSVWQTDVHDRNMQLFIKGL